MIITIDSVTYVIDNCAMDQAVIDFGLDGIAMVAWTGKGTELRQLGTNVTYSAVADPVMTGGLTGTATGKITTANFITNKLSSIQLIKNIGGLGAGNTTYNLALTGGSITIANGITYVTPANLGVVNVPIGYFTGTRAISGSVTAYLRTGSTNSAGLLSDLLAASATAAGTEPKFLMQIDIGGTTAGTRVEVEMPGAMLQIPTIDAQAVMSTTINFTAQGTDFVHSATANYDLENANELNIRYLSL
jgi:aryl carrier-like protein